MKSPFLAVGCVFLFLAACSAPQGTKLGSNGSGVAPVASGPAGPITKAANLTDANKGEMVSVYKNGTVTLTLSSSTNEGYQWRLAEIPDPTVLKLVSQDFEPGATATEPGKQKWVFQAVGSGDVDVKMWYGNMRTAPVSGDPTYNFIASVGDQTEPAKKHKKAKSTKA